MTGRSLRARTRSAAGFTIVELLVASLIMMAVTGAVFTVMNPAQGTFQAQPEVSDMQQRLRVGADALTRDLMMAGAGTYSGRAVGALGSYFAPVLPYRSGTLNPDAPGTYRTDTISVMYVPPTASQATVGAKMPQASSEIKVNREQGCPEDPDAAKKELCGFKEGMRALIFDSTGAFETFTITQVQEAAAHLQHNRDKFSKAYDVGARIAQVAAHTYYLKTDADAGKFQLMHYDGYLTNLPVVDNVVALSFEYYGEPAPPVLVKPLTDPAGPWTTYGPRPPGPGSDPNANDEYAAGENCTFKVDAVSLQQVPRLATLAATPTLVGLTPAMLSDGPWCPGEDAANRFDADLLRIREIRVQLRVQVALASLRGPAGVLFVRGGTSVGGERWIPDQEIRFDIAPRNMNLGR